MAAVIEQAKYVSGDTLKVTNAFSEKVYKMLKRAQDLELRKAKKNLSMNDVLDKVLSEYLKKNDPIEKAQRREDVNSEKSVKQIEATPLKNRLKTEHCRQNKTQSNFTKILFQNADIPFQRRAISGQLKRQVIHRDKDKCQHRYEDGSKCENQRFTEIHHKIPISYGGQNQLQNLITLCSGHHKVQHMNS